MLAAVLGSFSATDIATSESFAKLLENPAVRALYGMPFDTTNAGGFAVWRFGTILCVLAGLWALMATTRVLRGEEEAGRWDLLLTAPVTRGGVLLSHVKALGGGSVVVGLAVFGSFVAGGEPAGPAALYALGVTFLTLTFVAVGAVTSQLFGSRRRAAGTAGAVLGISYLIRMVADGTADGAWLRWASPLGWVENLEAFAVEQRTRARAARDHPADPVRGRGGTRPAPRHRRRDHPRQRHVHAPASACCAARSGSRGASASADSSGGGSDCSRSASSSVRSPRPSSTSSPPTPTSRTSPPSSASRH